MTTILRKSERNYYFNELESNKNYLKNQWRILNNIIGTKINRTKNGIGNIIVHDNKTITDSIEIAEIFNNHFINNYMITVIQKCKRIL